jgi:hypothetical protein
MMAVRYWIATTGVCVGCATLGYLLLIGSDRQPQSTYAAGLVSRTAATSSAHLLQKPVEETARGGAINSAPRLTANGTPPVPAVAGAATQATAKPPRFAERGLSWARDNGPGPGSSSVAVESDAHRWPIHRSLSHTQVAEKTVELEDDAESEMLPQPTVRSADLNTPSESTGVHARESDAPIW